MEKGGGRLQISWVRGCPSEEGILKFCRVNEGFPAEAPRCI